MEFLWTNYGEMPNLVPSNMAGISSKSQAQLAAKAAEKQALQREKPLTCRGRNGGPSVDESSARCWIYETDKMIYHIHSEHFRIIQIADLVAVDKT